MDVITKDEWLPIGSAPTNVRILAYRDAPSEEMAMVWLDLIDHRFYYSPQGGLVQWQPLWWQPLPDGKAGSCSQS